MIPFLKSFLRVSLLCAILLAAMHPSMFGLPSKNTESPPDSLLLVHADSGFTIKSYPFTGNIDIDPALVKNRKFSLVLKPYGTVGSVVFMCKDSVDRDYIKTENDPDWALFGNNGKKYNPWPWPSHRGYHIFLIAQIYEKKNMGGTVRVVGQTIGFYEPYPVLKPTVKRLEWSIVAYYIQTEKGDSLVDHKSIYFPPVYFENSGWPLPAKSSAGN